MHGLIPSGQVGRTFEGRRRAVVWLAALGIVLALASSATGQTNPRLALPHSNLDLPLQAPVFVAGHVALAAGGAIESLQKGGGAVFLFRPGAADRFLDFLYGWNSAMVLQAEYHRVNGHQRILSGDLIIRRYLSDFSAPAPRKSYFAGAGIGASEVTLAVGGYETGWEFLAEAGQEWNLDHSLLAYWQLQYRSYRNNGHDFSHWSLKLGAGIPLPW